MVRFRSRRLAAGFFICSVVLGACKKEEGQGGGAPGGASATSNKDLAVISAESEAVSGVDLAQGQKSALFKEYALPALTKSEEAQKRLATLKAKCNIGGRRPRWRAGSRRGRLRGTPSPGAAARRSATAKTTTAMDRPMRTLPT